MRASLFTLVLMLCIGLAEAQDIPDGGLGHPLGTYLTIEGVRAPQQYMSDTVNTLLVDTVNGKKLDTPGRIWVENADSLPKDTRCILRGYETGSMIGTPPAVIEAAKEEGKDFTPEQFGWRFQRGFIVLSVVEPKDLKKK